MIIGKGTVMRPIIKTTLIGGLFAAGMFMSIPASAQPFPCSGGPDEQMVGTTMEGPVTVPLCVTTAPQRGNSSTSRNGQGDPYHIPGYIEGPRAKPPKGWKPLFSAFVGFVSWQDEFGESQKHDYVLTLNHPTPEAARDAAVAECMAKAFFPDPTSACTPEIIDSPHLVLIRWTNEDNRYSALAFTSPESFGSTFVERSPELVEVCHQYDAPDFAAPCPQLIGYFKIGVWPD